MNKIIVKVQIPLYSNVINGECLVYSEGKKNLHTIPYTAEIEKKVDGAKAYFNATIDKKKQIVIDWNDKVEPQSW